MAAKVFKNVIRKKVTEDFRFRDEEFEALGVQLKEKIDKVFGRSLASENSTRAATTLQKSS
jgi:hypothetical protein